MRSHVDTALAKTDIARFRQEDPFSIGFASQLQGVAYEADDARVEFLATVVDEKGRGAAQGWSGADLAITAQVSDPREVIRKAILVQAKVGPLEHLSARDVADLREQLANMARLSRSPKIMEIRDVKGTVNPGIYSGVRYLAGASLHRYRLADYFVQRVLPTLDGDTRPWFVDAVQESRLDGLRVIAALREAQMGPTRR